MGVVSYFKGICGLFKSYKETNQIEVKRELKKEDSILKDFLPTIGVSEYTQFSEQQTSTKNKESKTESLTGYQTSQLLCCGNPIYLSI